MKTNMAIIGIAAATLLAAGCAGTDTSAYDQGPYLSQPSATPHYEATERFVLLDPAVQYSVNLASYMQRTLDDGRLEVTAHLRNRENRRIEVQAQCVFKDEEGNSTGDETPFQTVILTENATEQIKFVSSNNKAKRYTVRVRQAR